MKEHFTSFSRKYFIRGLLVLLLFSQQIYAQQTISGIVTDESDQGIPGVNIIVQGKNTGQITDFDGNYSIEVSPEDVLVISYVGYVTQRVTVGSQTTINVSLEQDVESLEDIVVIGYGTARRKDVTGAVAQITTKSFENQPLSRVGEALQGRASGVTVAKGGAPGAGFKVRVRGVNSVTGNNDPLVVVDGVFGGDLRTINPSDIASIEVLKDASALAIYGSRGSNGVILVSTKKGSGKTKLNFDHFTTISQLPKTIETLNSGDFARSLNANALTDGNELPYTDEQIAGFDTDPIDYQDALFQTGISNNTQLSLSGGDDKIRYFLSGNYVDQEGILITSDYERYSLRSNVSAKLSDRFTVGLNLYGSRETRVNDPDGFDRFKGSSIVRALTWDPTSPIRDENGDFVWISQRGNVTFNPIAILEGSNVERASDRLNAAMDFDYKITDSFSYKLIVGLTTVNRNIQNYRQQRTPGTAGALVAGFNNFRSTDHQVSNILNWKQSFGKHNLDLTGVYEFQGGRSTTNRYTVTDPKGGTSFFFSDRGEEAAESFSNDGNDNAIQSVLGRATYNFNSSLYLTGSMRIDESSRFGKDLRTGYFPSGAIAYSFDNMDFISNSEVLTSMKLRAGWGQVGNQNINSAARFSLTNDDAKYAFDGVTAIPGQRDSRVGNQELQWETTTQTNAGLDLEFWSGRLNLSIDYFQKRTDDLLLQADNKPVFDTRSVFKNVGIIDNKGIDFSLGGSIIQTDNFSWNSNFTLSHVKNEVVDLVNNLDQIVGNIRAVDGTESFLNVIEKGEPLGQFYGLTFLGTYKSTDEIPLDDQGAPIGQPGDAKYLLDENNERVLGSIGNGIPTLTWGFNNTFVYKNWDLNVFINAAHNFDIYNQVAAAIQGQTGDFRNNLSPVTSGNEWTPENETDIPRRGFANLLNSSRYVEDGSFIRLSNLTLGYTLRDVIKGVNSIKVYASGQNLALITDYSGYDPEVSSAPVNTRTRTSNTDAGSGINIGAYPNPRTYALGVKIGF